MAELKFKSTAEIKVPGKIVEQVIGQEEAVEVIKKAAEKACSIDWRAWNRQKHVRFGFSGTFANGKTG